MEKLVAKTEAEILSAKCHGDSLREELEKTETSRQEAVANSEALAKDLQDTKATLEKTQADCKALKEALKLAEHGNKQTKEEAEEMKHQINNLNKSVAKKIAAITALESKCETLKSTIDVTANSGMEVNQKMEYLRQMVSSKENELELIKNRCASLQTNLDDKEEKLKEKTKLEKVVEDAEAKITETSILLEKKSKELLILQERCDKLSAALKKAETLYLDGVENIKAEAEKKQREALEEATDRVYVLNGLLAKKDEELKALKETCEKLASSSGEGGAEGGETKAESETKRTEEFQLLTNKINFLDEMVSSKDTELTLVRTHCEELQLSIQKMQEAHEKQVSLIKDEAGKMVSVEKKEKEMELQALNREIAQRKSKLKSLNAGDQEEFEVVLDNGEDDCQLKEQVEALKKRCTSLENELEQAQGKSSTLEAAMNAGSSDGAAEQWKIRCSELEASLEKMTTQYQEENERRKEAEQVFATLSQKPSDEKLDSKPPRGVFGRSRPTPDSSDAKKPSRWLSLRGRKKRDDLTVRTFNATEEHTTSAGRPLSTSAGRPSSPSKYRSQLSPRRLAATVPPRPRSVAEGVPPATLGNERERILAQIPSHIKANFYEVGIYKQRNKNSYLPVLCLSPFDVPEGPIRNEWLSKFDGKSKVLNLGVYFLGKDGNEEGSYGTIPWFSFVPYGKAVQRGFDQIPKQIANKIDAGEALTHEEQQVCDGMKELVKMSEMNKEERRHPLQSHEGEVPKTIVTDSSNEDDQVSEMGI